MSIIKRPKPGIRNTTTNNKINNKLKKLNIFKKNTKKKIKFQSIQAIEQNEH